LRTGINHASEEFNLTVTPYKKLDWDRSPRSERTGFRSHRRLTESENEMLSVITKRNSIPALRLLIVQLKTDMVG